MSCHNLGIMLVPKHKVKTFYLGTKLSTGSLHPHILSFLFPWQTTAYPLLSPWGEGVLPIYNGGHGEASPKRGTFFGLNVYEREGISLCQWVIICQ